MNHRNTQKSKYSWILILCIIVGLISSLYLVFERHQIEKSQNHIENIVDYDAVLRANAFEKRSQQEAFDALRNAGVTNAIVILGLVIFPCLTFLFFAIDRKNMIAVIPISIFMICHLIYGVFNYII